MTFRRDLPTFQDKSVRLENLKQSQTKLTTTFPTKLALYVGDEENKNFNRIVVDKSLNTYRTLSDRLDADEIENDIKEFFKLCDEYNKLPTLSMLGAYIGIGEVTLSKYAKDPNTNSCKLKKVIVNAVEICHALLQDAALNSAFNSVLYLYLSKAVYGYNDNSTVNLTFNSNSNYLSNSESIKAIQEQIKNEQLVIDQE